MDSSSPKKRIIFALDVATLATALGFVDLLKDHVGVFKIGLELFTSFGPEAVRAVKERAPERSIFLDMKFHDIPATVKGALGSAGALGVEFVTAHCAGGSGMLRAAAEAAVDPGVKVLGVTVLTSLSAADLGDLDEGRFAGPEDLVLHGARIAARAGCAGVVCSGLEARAVKDEFGEGVLVVSPGIRFSTDAKDDQRRTTTPYEAVYNGADYIVVGRPIRNAADPARAAEEISKEIARALKERGF